MNLSNGRGENEGAVNFADDFFSSPSEREKKLIVKEASMLAFCMAFMLFLSYLLQTLFLGAGRLINKDLLDSEAFKEITVLISYAVSLTVPFSLFGAYTKIPAEKALKNRHTGFLTMLSCLFIALGVSVVGMFSSAFLTFFLSKLGIVFSASFTFPPTERWAFGIYLLNMTIVPALFEEIAFRGFLMQSLRRFGDGFALFASAFCFALIHITPTRFPHTFIMGLVIGYFVLFTGSLKTGVVIHFVYNSAIAFLSLLADSGSLDSAFLNLSFGALVLILALPGLFYLLKNYRGMFILRTGRAVNPAGENIRTFLRSRGMILFYVIVFVLAYKDLVVL